MKRLADKYLISELVFLQISGDISNRQKEILLAWVNESEENKLFFQHLLSKESYKAKLQVYQAFDQQARWGNIAHAITKYRRKRLLKYSAIAASFLMLFASGGYLLFYSGNNEEGTQTVATERQEPISPGGKDAILITEEGSIRLSAEKFQINSSGSSIVNNGQTVSYTDSKTAENAKKLVYNTIMVPRGGEYKLVLADGTQVWLNSESEIRFPIRFGEVHRQVWLQGEAYFKVVENKRKPFSVMVDGKTVEVLGTSFNIKAYEDEDQMVTTLESGAVKFSYGDQSQPLSPNHQIVFSESHSSMEMKKVNVAEVIAWVNGEFYFKSLELKEIMKQLGRWYDFDVDFKDKELEGYLFRGFISRKMEFREVADIIEETSKVNIKLDGKTVEVSF